MYSLAAFRQIEERMEPFVLPAKIYEIIESLTIKVGGQAAFVQKQVKESLVGLLNKLTNDTYTAISSKILASSPTVETIDDIFKVACNNTFYSKVYARLCNQIIAKNESVRTHVQEKCTAFIDCAEQVTSKDRGMTTFVANLALNGTLPLSECVRYAHLLQSNVEANTEGNDETVAEYVEHLAILLTLNKSLTDACALEPRIKVTVELDTKKYKGVTLKTVFKYMDILDHFK
jgi:hypothetical protein